MNETKERLVSVINADLVNFDELVIICTAYGGISALNHIFFKNDFILYSTTIIFACWGFYYGRMKFKKQNHAVRFSKIVRNIPSYESISELEIRAIDYDNEFNVEYARYWVAETIHMEGK